MRQLGVILPLLLFASVFGTSLLAPQSRAQEGDTSPKCEGPLNESSIVRLLEGGVTERRAVALLVTCGMAFNLTSERKSKLKELGVSDEALRTIEWLAEWESLANKVESVSPAKPRMDISGAWTATFSDSGMNGTLHVNLVQDENGTVQGTYSSSLGGGGTILGTVWENEGKLELRQNVEGCPGVTKAVLRRTGASLDGEYVGFDCRGPHLNGRFTFSAGLASPKGDDKPATLVQGSVLELRLVRTVYVLAQVEQTAERQVIESILQKRRVPLSDSAIKADLHLGYGFLEGRPFMAAARLVEEHNAIRIIWVCPSEEKRPEASRIAEHCTNEFADAYEKAHGN